MLLSPRGRPAAALRSPRQELGAPSRALAAPAPACSSAARLDGPGEPPARRCKLLVRLHRRKRAGKRGSGRAQVTGATLAAGQWPAHSPPELLRYLQQASVGAYSQLQAQLPLLAHRPAHPLRAQLLLGHAVSLPVPHQATLNLTATIAKLLAEPPGGYPVRVLGWLPGSSVRAVPGPRRLLGLLPGKSLLVAVPGPWWTPSGAAHLLQHVPVGVWLLLVAGLVALGATAGQRLLQGRRRREQARALEAAAAAADLVRQRSRMLRAMGAAAAELEAAEVEADEPLALPDPDWQQPREWDSSALRQWREFMRQSRALRISRERWWEHGAVTDVPHFKAAADALQRSGSAAEPECC